MMKSEDLIKELKAKIVEDVMDAQDLYNITEEEKYKNYITVLLKYHSILKQYELKEGD